MIPLSIGHLASNSEDPAIAAVKAHVLKAWQAPVSTGFLDERWSPPRPATRNPRRRS